MKKNDLITIGEVAELFRNVISKNPINLLFQTGNAKLNLDAGSPDLKLSNTADNFHGCLTLISY